MKKPSTTDRGIGDNNPPDPTIDQINPLKLADPTTVVPVLRANYQLLTERRDEFLQGIPKWINAHSSEIPGNYASMRTTPIVVDDEDCGDTLDYLTLMREFITKEVEPARKKVKDPVLKTEKAIDSWFNDGVANIVLKAKKPIEDAYTQFLRDKLGKIERERKEAAAAQAAEAARLAEQAKRAADEAQQDALIDQAIEMEEAAARLKAAAAESVADMTRVRSDMGSVGGLTVNWRWETVELMDLVQAVAQGRESISMLTTNDVFINSLVRPKDGKRKIAGLRIFPDTKGR